MIAPQPQDKWRAGHQQAIDGLNAVRERAAPLDDKWDALQSASHYARQLAAAARHVDHTAQRNRGAAKAATQAELKQVMREMRRLNGRKKHASQEGLKRIEDELRQLARTKTGLVRQQNQARYSPVSAKVLARDIHKGQRVIGGHIHNLEGQLEAHARNEQEWRDRLLYFSKCAEADARKKVIHRKMIAEKRAGQLGISARQLRKMRIVLDRLGGVNYYFAGFGAPDGPGHGHIFVDENGTVGYARMPGEPHGIQNVMARYPDYHTIVERYLDQDQFGFRCRFNGANAYASSNPSIDGSVIVIRHGPNGPFGGDFAISYATRDTPLQVL